MRRSTLIWRRLSTESKNGDAISSSDAFYESATEKWRRSLQEKKEHAKPMDSRDFSVPPKPTKTMYVPSRGNEHQPHMFVPESAADKYRKRREAGEVSNIFEKELEELKQRAKNAKNAKSEKTNDSKDDSKKTNHESSGGSSTVFFGAVGAALVALYLYMDNASENGKDARTSRIGTLQHEDKQAAADKDKPATAPIDSAIQIEEGIAMVSAVAVAKPAVLADAPSSAPNNAPTGGTVASPNTPIRNRNPAKVESLYTTQELERRTVRSPVRELAAVEAAATVSARVDEISSSNGNNNNDSASTSDARNLALQPLWLQRPRKV